MQIFPIEPQWHIAAWRVGIKFLRLRYAVLKAGYDPIQPRAPAGTRIGGQWIATGTNADTERMRVAASAYDNPGLYYVDLAKEELKGGHGFSKHVARSDTQLIAYQWLWRFNNSGSLHPAEGSFNSPSEANNLVSQVLRFNADAVQQVIDGKERILTLTHRFGFQTGREAFSSDDISPFVIRPTFWVEVIIRQHQSPPGYVVLTAYPMNDTPNEVSR